jgi:hypothetical protein
MNVPHDVMIAAKVSMLESLMRDLFEDRFKSMNDPIEAAKQYAATRIQIRPDAKIEPDPIREAVWQEFLDSVVAGVREAGQDHR